MNERLHRVLDGDLPREALSPKEQAELREAEVLISGVLGSVPTSTLPDLGPAVLSQLEPYPSAATPVSVWSALRDWFWAPRPLSLQWRPAYAFALAAIVFLGVTLGDKEAATAQQVLIQFRLDAPQARNVALAGNFTGWQPRHQLTRTANGVWTVIVPLQEGVHKYAFVIDGETWQPDPMAPAVSDGFGGQNSQIAVLSPDLTEES